jgi:hypothetical protein
MCGVHIVCTKSLRCTSCHAFSPARGIVVDAIDHGTVAVHQNRPAISILFVCVHPDTEQEHHAPVPAILQGCVEFGEGPLKERGRGNEEDKVHHHLLVVAPKGPAVDKLLAKEVLVPDIKAAEDLNLGPITTSATLMVAHSPLHPPHQPSDLTLTKLIVPPILRRKPKASKPVAAIVVQVMRDFILEVFQNPMFSDVIGVCLRRLGGSNCFAQGCITIVLAMVATAKQTMNHPVRMPSSRYCTGVYLLNCPWFSCSSTHYSVGKQARQLHSLAGATWVLQNASTVKISAHQSLCLIVHSWPKKFTLSKLTWINACLFTQSLHGLLKIYAEFAHFRTGGFP